MCVVSIHQPNFFPHYPFFQKMEQSDIFVSLTCCQFEKNNYQNRFMLEGNWYTMSVNSGLNPIWTKRYLNYEKDFERICKSLPKYQKILNLFEHCIESSLSITNQRIITEVAEQLEIKAQLKNDYETTLTGTERLVHICQNYGATKYLSGVSGKNYMDLSLFDKAGIEVIFQEPSPSKPILEVLYERR